MSGGGATELPGLDSLDVAGRRVFVRVDMNVPLADGVITDDRRIRAALPTLTALLERGAALVVATHVGRPRGEIVPELSTRPIAERLSELLGRPVRHATDVVGDSAEGHATDLAAGEVLLLENLRYDPREKAGDPEFAGRLASFADAYVNDAFGAAHRAHASISVVPGLLPQRAAGRLLSAEVEYLEGVVREASRPFVLVFGGAKVSDKVPVLERLLTQVDVAVIGGGMAYTFLVAQGVDVGSSRLEPDLVETARRILDEAERRGVRVLLPVDHVCAQRLADDAECRTTETSVPDGWLGLDIGPRTQKLYAEAIASARTILWNGPMGVFELPAFRAGTASVGAAIAAATDGGAVSIVGGGDTAAAASIVDVADRMTHVSTGGGASLELLEGKRLPGVAALLGGGSA